jgi:autotransporter passenger strand-loop-strand repeat protein
MPLDLMSLIPESMNTKSVSEASPGGSIVNTGTLTVDQDSLDALNGTSYEEIAAWGDSLTAGNAAGPGNQYPSQLAKDFNGDRTVLNEGQGGDTSTQIADRLIAATSLLNDTVVIWAGLNNVTDPSQVLADTERMVSALGSNTHYVILSLINPDGPNNLPGHSVYNDIAEVNAQLASTFPGHYLDVLSILVNDYNPASPTDVVDHNNGVVPTSLRLDDGHLNAAGNAIVAQAVHNFIATRLDGPLPPTFTIAGSGVITTAAPTLNLSGFNTAQNTIETTSPVGTTFTVDNANTAMHILADGGFNTLIDDANNFTLAERKSLFSHGIEEVVEKRATFLAPGANPPPTITGLTDDTGRFDDDGVTNQINPTVEGTALAGSTVSIDAISATGTLTLLGQTQAGSSGIWSFQLAAPSDETVDLCATESLGSGPASVPSNSFQVTVDTTPPPTPSLTLISPGRRVSATQSATTATVLKFMGKAQSGSEIEIFVDGQLVGTTEAKPSGVWIYYNAALVLSQGEHTFYTIAEDVAGNFSKPSANLNIDVETAPPVAPTITSVNGFGIDSTGGFDVQGGGVIFYGKGAAGDTVRLYLGAAFIGSTIVGAGGGWDFDYVFHPLASGAYSFDARQVDLAGVQSGIQSAHVSIASTTLSGSTEITSGHTIADAFVTPNITLTIEGGADADSVRVAGNNAADLIFGAATGMRITSGGRETVEPGGATTDTSVASSGGQTVLSGGVATGTIVLSGGGETIRSGGIADNTTVKAGGALASDGSLVFLNSGAADLLGTLSGGGTVTEQGGGELVLGGTAADFLGRITIADGSLLMFNTTLGGVLVLDAGTSLNGAGVVDGPVRNLGSIAVDGGLLEFAGVVGGPGTVSIRDGTADFTAAFDEDVSFSGSSGVLELGEAQAYAGRISGLSKAGTNSLDLSDISYVAGVTEVTAAETSTSTKLTIVSGAQTATIALLGDYEGSTFVASSDGHGGTSIVDPSPARSIGAQSLHALTTAAAGFGVTPTVWTEFSAEAPRARLTSLGLAPTHLY